MYDNTEVRLYPFELHWYTTYAYDNTEVRLYPFVLHWYTTYTICASLVHYLYHFRWGPSIASNALSLLWQVSHRSLLFFTRWAMGRYSISPSDAVAARCRLSFDVSMQELVVPLCAGARLVLMSER